MHLSTLSHVISKKGESRWCRDIWLGDLCGVAVPTQALVELQKKAILLEPIPLCWRQRLVLQIKVVRADDESDVIDPDFVRKWVAV